MAAKRKSGLKRAPAKRTPRKAKPGTRGLSPAECRLDSLSAEAEEVLKTMRERAAKFNTGKIKQEDLANVGGAPDTED